jgi:tetratricopeptide (TPR) repeat protein
MLHALRKDQAAGDLLKEIVEAVEASQDVRSLLETELGRDVGSTKSRLCFFYAEHEGQQGNAARQRELLLEGYQHDPRDADLLIAMYHLPQADEAWTRETRQRINTAAEEYRRQIRELQDQANTRQGEDRALALGQLALMNNQLAWLAANTDGDADEAIRCSLESLRLLESRSGFLDTLGRCYYAKGDFANAVKFQTRAVAQEPHSPAMVAQLALFQKALQEQESAKVPGGQPAPAK